MLVELVVQPNCKLLRQKNMFKLQASKTVPKPKNINQLIRDLDFWDCFKGGWGGGGPSSYMWKKLVYISGR